LIGSTKTDGNQPKEEAKHINIPIQNEIRRNELAVENGENILNP
jgi:hypothetical protein